MAVEVRRVGDVVEVSDADLDGVDGGDQETSYQLRTITADKIRELQAPYLKQRFNKRTHKLEDVPLSREDESSFAADILDYVILDWSGIVYQGQPLACIREHKVLLDMPRRTALLEVAGLNKAGAAAEVAREESFREPESVLHVLGR